jgi:hypothetical protein
MASYRAPDEDPAHDVLAADEFAMPSADPSLRRRPFVLPEDPSGIAEPHDILAAEEFAMPAVAGVRGGATAGGRKRRRVSRLGAAAAVLTLVRLRRRRRLTHN